MATPASSRRTSLDTNRSSPSRTDSLSGPSAVPQHRRANRALLRDYYGLKASPETAHDGGDDPSVRREEAQVPHSDVDEPGFDATAYVQQLLAKESLEGLLREGGRLVNEIRTLDGERGALVYDNYARLITATDTIRQMRSHVGGSLANAGATSTLGPAVAHIASTAEALASATHDSLPAASKARTATAGTSDSDHRRTQQRQTVQWALATPMRLQACIKSGDTEKAQADWAEIEPLLDRWNAVKGVSELRQQCLAALQP